MSRGNSLSDELDLRSVLGDTRVICIDYVPFWGSYSEPKGNRVRETEQLLSITTSCFTAVHMNTSRRIE